MILRKIWRQFCGRTVKSAITVFNNAIRDLEAVIKDAQIESDQLSDRAKQYVDAAMDSLKEAEDAKRLAEKLKEFLK